MFESLSGKLTAALGRLSNRSRLNENDVDEGMKAIRVALLEADVNFRVVRDFVQSIRDKIIGNRILQSITPSQQITKIVNEELIQLLGGQSSAITSSSALNVIMLAGLQGSGKTTTAAKLAFLLKQSGDKLLLVAADNRRIAAVDQLKTLAESIEIPVYSGELGTDAVTICSEGLKKAREMKAKWVIIDTAGRLHVDDELMMELQQLRDITSPTELLLVVDAMAGQDAVNSAQVFHETIGATGIIMTKMEGDARGGAALSIRHVTGLPVKYMGTGERIADLETFHPDRLASRILGMGDVLTLVERAEQSINEERAMEIERKIRKNTFDLEDFLEQLQQMKRMGPISQLMDMIPGFSALSKRQVDEQQLQRTEAIIFSMTPSERRNPNNLNGSRKKRIALGSGTTNQQVNQLLNQFRQIQKLMKGMSSGTSPQGLRNLFR